MKARSGRSKQASAGRKPAAGGTVASPEAVVDTPEAAVNTSREAFSLPPVLTIHEAEQVKADLVEMMQLPGPVALDGGAVERVDTAGLQLLASLIKSCRSDVRAFSWTGWSPEFERAAQILGLSNILALEGNGE